MYYVVPHSTLLSSTWTWTCIGSNKCSVYVFCKPHVAISNRNVMACGFQAYESIPHYWHPRSIPNYVKVPPLMESWTVSESLVEKLDLAPPLPGSNILYTCWFWSYQSRTKESSTTICDFGFEKNTKPVINPLHQHLSCKLCTHEALEMLE
jgi:hypothetical protein